MIDFINENSDFTLITPDTISSLYFPLANDAGMMAAITPELKGDLKTGDDSFLLEPVTVEDLHKNSSGRNFWVHTDRGESWSACGNSAAQKARRHSGEEDSRVTCGLLWHTVERDNPRLGLHARITNFVPFDDERAEYMEVEIKNIGNRPMTITPTAAIPVYARSASNIRDHRHVTSLLSRVRTTRYGITVKPTLIFDEKGHRQNVRSYSVFGADDAGSPPAGFFPLTPDFIGEGGSFDHPLGVIENLPAQAQAGEVFEGYEALGGLRFSMVTLSPGESRTYRIVLTICSDPAKAGTSVPDGNELPEGISRDGFARRFAYQKKMWRERTGRLVFHTGDAVFDHWVRWVSVQPHLRKIFGCSYLPHFDYGKGGRGWRDLWQDCLALILTEPERTRPILLNNFAGVRTDGTNATIIGSAPGEFLADRNNIPRVWMDHGVWPFHTTLLYIDSTGDTDILFETQTWFQDHLRRRCALVADTAHPTRTDGDPGTPAASGQNVLLTTGGAVYTSSVLEHILVQHLCSFFNVGGHNTIRIEGADWNDGLDMARANGESVAFSSFYGYNFVRLAKLLRDIAAVKNMREIELLENIIILLDRVTGDPVDYNSPHAKQTRLSTYYDSLDQGITGTRRTIDIESLAADLETKGNHILEWIRTHEWLGKNDGEGWCNGYYDNDGKRLEGDHPAGIRMTLTGQVFALLSGAATGEQAAAIIASVDRHLFDNDAGGPRLNTDFGEVLLSMGRCFGFAYGHKENGAVFSHMAVMYANALYERGFAREGHRVLTALHAQAMNFGKSRMYPGIPEYFDIRGRGMYPYLTGSASWYLLTLLAQSFGIKGMRGDLVLHPRLLASQFDDDGCAIVTMRFAGRTLSVVFHNPGRLDVERYRIVRLSIDSAAITSTNHDSGALIPRNTLAALPADMTHTIDIELG